METTGCFQAHSKFGADSACNILHVALQPTHTLCFCVLCFATHHSRGILSHCWRTVISNAHVLLALCSSCRSRLLCCIPFHSQRDLPTCRYRLVTKTPTIQPSVPPPAVAPLLGPLGAAVKHTPRQPDQTRPKTNQFHFKSRDERLEYLRHAFFVREDSSNGRRCRQ